MFDSEPGLVRHGKDYPIMTVDIDDMDAGDELFRNWIRSAGITSITVRSPFDPYERKDTGLLAEQVDNTNSLIRFRLPERYSRVNQAS